MGVPNSMCKKFGEVWPTGTWDVWVGHRDYRVGHRYFRVGYRDPYRDPAKFKNHQIFAHALGDPHKQS